MGKAIQEAARESGALVKLGCDLGDNGPELLKHAAGEIDVVIDFSFHTATADLVEAAASAGLPVVIGTTGHSAEERARILACTDQIPVVWSGNYAVGVNVLFWAVRELAAVLGEEFEPEIVEYHHRAKKDAPSGTAERLAEVILEARQWPTSAVRHGREGITGERPHREIGMHALRGGAVIGEHTVHFASPDERLEITHRAGDRRIFALGALRAARWVVGRAPGLYRMENVLGLHRS